MNKKEILKKYSVSSLEDVSDNDIMQLALSGSLGDITEVSARKDWCFKKREDLVNHIRKAIELGKELAVSFSFGEFEDSDEVIVEYV